MNSVRPSRDQAASTEQTPPMRYLDGVVNVYIGGDTNKLSMTAKRLYEALCDERLTTLVSDDGTRATSVYRHEKPFVPSGHGVAGGLSLRHAYRGKESDIWSSMDRQLKLSEPERTEALEELDDELLVVLTVEPIRIVRRKNPTRFRNRHVFR